MHALAAHYGVAVILHTDHAARKLLPWIDELIKANTTHKKAHGVPLFSSHMLDLSEDDFGAKFSDLREVFGNFKRSWNFA